MSRFAETIDRLEATIAARKGADPGSSYTAKLLGEGPERAAKKFGEEAVEAVIAAIKGDPEELAAESADVIYHWLVMLSAAGVAFLAGMAVRHHRRERRRRDGGWQEIRNGGKNSSAATEETGLAAAAAAGSAAPARG